MAVVDDVDDLRELLRTAPLVDGHNDLLWELRERAGYDLDTLDVGGHVPQLQTDLPRLRAGGVGAQFWSVYVPSTLPGPAAVTAVLEQLDAWRMLVARYPDRLAPALTADDVDRAVGEGRIASLAGMEGGHSIDGSLGVLRAMYRLGARYLTLTHNDNTPWADAATDEPVHGGLTAFGRTVVAELNRLGMLVDLSHVAPATMHAALDTSRAPVIFSHSSARALVDHPRNVPDDVLERMARAGGVCMVTFAPGFVSQPVADAWLDLLAAERAWRAELPDDPEEVRRRVQERSFTYGCARATLEQVADHVDHVRDVAGVDAVGIGGDFDGVPDTPVGLEDVAAYPRLFAELRRRGWSDDELRRLAGRNVLRVLRAAEDVARDLAGEAPALAPRAAGCSPWSRGISARPSRCWSRRSGPVTGPRRAPSRSGRRSSRRCCCTPTSRSTPRSRPCGCGTRPSPGRSTCPTPRSPSRCTSTGAPSPTRRSSPAPRPAPCSSATASCRVWTPG
jgi:membrane dipeptidase